MRTERQPDDDPEKYENPSERHGNRNLDACKDSLEGRQVGGDAAVPATKCNGALYGISDPAYTTRVV
jgi:hypothetical protein